MAAITTTSGAHHDDVDPNASFLDKKGVMSWLVTLDRGDRIMKVRRTGSPPQVQS